jgi:putative tryptophan/tyrosine transport system substrate-binding protein
MDRRNFLLAAALAMLSPGLVRAQSAQRPRLGVLLYGNPHTDPNIESFRRGFRDLGYSDGKNVTIEYRYADGRPERLPELAAELLRLKPDVILAFGGDVVVHVHPATKTIPIIFAISSDPVLSGLVASMSRPGGNATGFTFLQDQLAGKRLFLLKDLLPRTTNVGFLYNPLHLDNELREAQRTASDIGVTIYPAETRRPADFDRALEEAKRVNVDALYVVSSRETVANAGRIVDFGMKNNIPVIGGWGTWAQSGALFSYGPNVIEIARQVGDYVDRVLKGAKPGDLPAQQPTRFELVVNVKTADRLGLKIPEAFLLQADKVIE